jgi:peptidyl-prolyl cis-trans isomerase A (cyclophilin A)
MLLRPSPTSSASPKAPRSGTAAPRRATNSTTAASSTGSQFFITVADTGWLTGKHTIFGEVVEGYDIVEKISKVPTASQDRPRTAVVLESVTIERVA